MESNIQNLEKTDETIQKSLDYEIRALRKEISAPADMENMKQEIRNEFTEQIQITREELIDLINRIEINGGGSAATPAIGTSSGQCIACGRGAPSVILFLFLFFLFFFFLLFFPCKLFCIPQNNSKDDKKKK